MHRMIEYLLCDQIKNGLKMNYILKFMKFLIFRNFYVFFSEFILIKNIIKICFSVCLDMVCLLVCCHNCMYSCQVAHVWSTRVHVIRVCN